MENESNEVRTETAESEQAAAAETVAEAEKPRKGRKKALLCVLALLIVAAAAYGFPYMKYEYACYQRAQGNYEVAQQQFQELGDFKDSAERSVEARNMQQYLMAKALMDSGDYRAARCALLPLWDFLDGEALWEEARRMELVVKQYEMAEMEYLGGLYWNAYDTICQIEDEPYDAILPLKAQILSGIYEQMMEHWDSGETLLARHELRMLEEENAPEVESIWEKLVQENRMELDTSYYDAINQDHITSFQASTTAGDYATIFKYLYLSDVPSLTLRASGSRPGYARLDRRLWDGLDLVDGWLPEYACVYDQSYEIEYDDAGGVIKLTVRNEGGEANTLEEARGHVEAIDAYCKETVRMLNDELLLTNTMSNKAKARIILEWVCNYLDYDDSQEIHDAFVAIQNEIGVCESYTAIYNHMCNLAGVPSFGQIGLANDEGVPTEDDRHIWSVQLDEEGNAFYTDSTWADGSATGRGITRQEFVAYMEQITSFLGLFSPLEVEEWDSAYETASYLDSQYFWQESIWDSHHPGTDFGEIQAFYERNIS